MGQSYEAATLFTLHAKGYESGAKSIVSANQSIKLSQDSVARSADKMGKGLAGRGQMFAQNLAFGIEDAAVSAQLSGWQGALRGASNNISMMAMALGGVKSLFVAIGLTIAASVVAPLSTLAQKTRVFSQVGEHLKRFEDGLKARVAAIQQMRAIEDSMRNFRATRDSGSLFASLDSQQLASARAKEDLTQVKRDLAEVKALRDELVRVDRDELQRKNILQRGLASVNPAVSDLISSVTGIQGEDLTANTKEIRAAFDPIIQQLEQQLKAANNEELKQRHTLNKMVAESPRVLASITGKTADQAKRQFQAAMAEGELGLRAQYEQEVADIKATALADAAEVRRLIDSPARKGEMIASIEQARDLMLDHARQKFEKTIESRLQEAEDGLLSPLESSLKSINVHADALREDVLASSLDKQSRKSAIERIEAAREAALAKAGTKPFPGIRSPTTSTIFAGDSRIFEAVLERSNQIEKDQLTELKKIARSVGKSSYHKIEIIQ